MNYDRQIALALTSHDTAMTELRNEALALPPSIDIDEPLDDTGEGGVIQMGNMAETGQLQAMMDTLTRVTADLKPIEERQPLHQPQCNSAF